MDRGSCEARLADKNKGTSSLKSRLLNKDTGSKTNGKSRNGLASLAPLHFLTPPGLELYPTHLTLLQQQSEIPISNSQTVQDSRPPGGTLGLTVLG